MKLVPQILLNESPKIRGRIELENLINHCLKHTRKTFSLQDPQKYKFNINVKIRGGTLEKKYLYEGQM